MKRNKVIGLFALVMALIMVAPMAFACTPMAAGKDATVDGSVIVSHTCDGWYDNRIQIIPAATYPEGTMVDVYGDTCVDTRPNRPVEWQGQIPQATSTYTYFHIGYPFMNEKNVVMGEHTWSGRQELYSQSGMMYIANLQIFGLQRAASAKEAVQIMGEIAETYGYQDGGECLLVGDPNEVWVFEVCGAGPLWTADSGTPGAHWAARRLADDEFFVGANRARLGEIDFTDTEHTNWMWSTDITAFPKQMGWWEEGTPFHFANIFNPGSEGNFNGSRREWRAFTTVAPSQEFPLIDATSHYPWSVKPDEKISIQTIMDLYGDHLEGTIYDKTADLAAGPFGTPNRPTIPADQRPEGRTAWERSINTPGCSYSFVAQTRNWLPEAVATVLWFSEDSADTSVYVPIYGSVTKVPKAWTQAIRHEFDRNSAWWAFNFVNNWANLRWNAMYQIIREKKASYEDVFFANQDAIEAEAVKLYNEDPALAVKFLTDYTYTNMDKVEKEWWDFAEYLVGKFYDFGMINEEGAMSSPPLLNPAWAEAVDFGGTVYRDRVELYGE